MTTNELVAMYEKKLEFVDSMSFSLRMIPNITEVHYELFVDKEGRFLEEFLKVVYVGGGIGVINCNGNSLSAILRAAGQIVDGGYYVDEKFYEDIKREYVELKTADDLKEFCKNKAKRNKK